LRHGQVAIGYEPIWAIGPGKTPPDAEYIGFVSRLIKDKSKALYGIEVPVVYGGGLKPENAKSISGVDSINGGLIALTKFTDEIGFHVDDLKEIIGCFMR
jgi:triosephosphate isomerase